VRRGMAGRRMHNAHSGSSGVRWGRGGCPLAPYVVVRGTGDDGPRRVSPSGPLAPSRKAFEREEGMVPPKSLRPPIGCLALQKKSLAPHGVLGPPMGCFHEPLAAYPLERSQARRWERVVACFEWCLWRALPTASRRAPAAFAPVRSWGCGPSMGLRAERSGAG
jgi:hypothetical protein